MVARKTAKKKTKGKRGVARHRPASRTTGKAAPRPKGSSSRKGKSSGSSGKAKGPRPKTKGPKAKKAGRPAAARRQSARAAKSRPAKGKPKKGRASAKRKKPARALREKQPTKTQKQRERDKLQRERERERAQKQHAREKREREKERVRAQKQREKEVAQKRRERERLRAEQAAERERRQREQAAAREKTRRLREEEREEKRREREEAKRREQEERERAREDARRKKEEERERKEAEREAYRKAKEEERERLRAEKEAARRALEGKIARANRRAQRAAGLGRASTTRVYRPDAIPNQSGTTRRAPENWIEERPVIRPPPPQVETPPPAAPPAPAEEPPAPTPERVEDRYTLIRERLQALSEPFQREYQDSFDMSWIHHDSALEGVVYTFQELKTALDPSVTVVPDSSLQPVCEEIRRHKAAIELVRELAEKKRVPVNVDLIKRIYLTLHPSEGDLKSVKYRKDIPQHRLYFHEYAAPDKIAYKVRQVVDWLNGPEPKKIKHPVRIAARAHYDLLRVFPFPIDSGKVARLMMNLLLLRAGYPPAIVHSTERQRYYEALRGSLPTIVAMINESIENGLSSVEKRLEEEARRLRTGTA
jgi:hypothetical protein